MIKHYHDELSAARTELLRVYHRVPDPNVKKDITTWSAREIMHHLFLSEQGIAKVYRALDRVCAPCPAYSDGDLEQERDGLTSFLANRNERVQAPERIQPIDLDESVDVLAELHSSRDLLMSQSGARSDEQLRSFTFPHVLRGNLSLYGWLWFIAQHERRHTEQIRLLL